jgi:hypothetical protein
MFKSQHRQEINLLSKTSRLTLRPTQPPIQWAMDMLSMVVKQLQREPAHSSSSRAKVKNEWLYTSAPPYTFITCTVTT